MNRIITYGILPDGTVISRVGDKVAFPVPDYEAIGNGGDGYAPGDFRGPTRYSLESSAIHPYFREGDVTYAEVTWTKGFGNSRGVPVIPVKLKNKHREFWGFKPLKSTEERQQ